MRVIRDRPIQLLPIFRERVWGRKSLAPYFADLASTEHIGEVWYTFSENLTSLGVSLGKLVTEEPEILGTGGDSQNPGICPLLVKLLFTSERLSVQVHPNDDYAQRHHQSLGKTEAWYIVGAEPPAEIAVGFRKEISGAQLRAAAESGEIEKLLAWRQVGVGEMIYVPAGTVHAIGAGLIVCEIQENSDITYRLYDYGRPRELHLEHGAAVSHLGPHRDEFERIELAPGRVLLGESPYFRIEHLQPDKHVRLSGGSPFYLLLICLKGSGYIGQESFQAGQCWLVPAGNQAIEIDGSGSEWILAYGGTDIPRGVRPVLLLG